ncbi:MAG: hypothetical protein HWQ35_02500 [Nostoc sp. NMS1]|uniref:hypothetical protein n=1 Tax=unclassified Nostoc TaxID=2593658 RepID=UPI0025FDEA55|nr:MULTISPECIES: hypothetical protein [unclassified Nostoc]MBN3905484.1 hypothetical protein [Nostoc sp. NMS1]MBN3994375.1 hypothetical protein [Nostoc sp. NMS2]
MKPSFKDNDNLLFRLFCKGLKYFLLALLGVAVVFVVSQTFRADMIVRVLLSEILWIWIARIAIFLVCLFAIAMIIESWS